jgi:hypothetical protein
MNKLTLHLRTVTRSEYSRESRDIAYRSNAFNSHENQRVVYNLFFVFVTNCECVSGIIQ